jgi:hypothetical protein
MALNSDLRPKLSVSRLPQNLKCAHRDSWDAPRGSGRGRDSLHWPPPAQIRTSASTHTALLKGEWRESKPRLRFASRTPSKRWDMHIPAQSQEHVRLNDVPLQLHPSLPTLRSSLRRLVRMVHRYYGAVRLLQHVHVRRTALGLHGPAFA